MPKIKKRCPWCTGDPLYEKYHDTEWGVVCRDDNKLFEMISLEAFQAGLSWRTVLYKRENFRRAFKNFDPVKVARFKAKDIARLLKDAGIIRNRQKIESVIHNAQIFLQLKKEFGSFSRYIWQFAPKRSVRRRSVAALPAITPESERMAKSLKSKGFKFLGSTTCYAFMQSTGMVNDHIQGCFRAR